MEKTSVRLSPEIAKKLQLEARKLGELYGESVTVSELIRACIEEKFPQVSERIRREGAALLALTEEVAALGIRVAQVEKNQEKLTKTLAEIVPKLATREQVGELTNVIAEVISAMKRR